MLILVLPKPVPVAKLFQQFTIGTGTDGFKTIPHMIKMLATIDSRQFALDVICIKCMLTMYIQMHGMKSWPVHASLPKPHTQSSTNTTIDIK